MQIGRDRPSENCDYPREVTFGEDGMEREWKLREGSGERDSK